MSLRWLQLGTLSLLAFPTAWASAQAPRQERDGGLTPPVIQVVAKQPIDEEEMLVEVIKAMPRTRDELKPKSDLSDNFKVIRVKRDRTDEPMMITSDEPAVEIKHSRTIEKAAEPPAPRKLEKTVVEKPVVDKPVEKVISEKIIKVRRDEPQALAPVEKQKSVPASTASKAPALLPEESTTRVMKSTMVKDEAYASDWSMPSLGLPTCLSGLCAEPVFDPCNTFVPTLADSNVGWIDSALIGTHIRFRYDSRWNNRTPDRAEFFTGRNQQYFNGTDIGGRGFGVPESNIDMMEASTYVEWAFTPRFSAFMEMPLRYIDPTENKAGVGWSDLSVGFKLAYFVMPDQVQTFQLRLTTPTGAAGRGLGTGHTTIEPSLLLWQKLSDDFTLESEFRNWIPVGGTNHAGYTLRYALGLSYNMYQNENVSIRPVTELIAWSTLRGFESRFIDSLPTFQSTHTASGTVLESAWGVRGTLYGNCDWYVGYSFNLTNTSWFDDNFRLEVRWRF